MVKRRNYRFDPFTEKVENGLIVYSNNSDILYARRYLKELVRVHEGKISLKGNRIFPKKIFNSEIDEYLKSR